jgi:hypothetical protein
MQTRRWPFRIGTVGEILRYQDRKLISCAKLFRGRARAAISGEVAHEG